MDSNISQKIILDSSIIQKSPKGQKRKRAGSSSVPGKSKKINIFTKPSKQLRRFFGTSHRNYGPYLSSNVVRCSQNGHFEPDSIEAGRRIVKRVLGKRSQNLLKVTIFPTIIFTSKPKAIRMGKGKGSPKIKRAHSRVGKIIYKLSSSHSWYGRLILHVLHKRLPIKFNICSFSQPGLIIRI